MGSRNASNSDGDGTANCNTQFVLNVYDLTPINHCTVCPWNGIWIWSPQFPVECLKWNLRLARYFVFRFSIPLGHINIPPSEFQTFIERVASEYHGDTDHLISKNCNNFTDDIVSRLIGKCIPGWVNQLAWLGNLCSFLLPESLQATTIKQFPEYHACTEEDGTEPLSTVSHECRSSKLLLSPSAGNSDVAFIKKVQR